MQSVKHIDVEIDKNTLSVVLNAFEVIRGDYSNLVEKVIMMVNIDDIEKMIDKLSLCSDSLDDPVVISMDFSDWTTYYSLLVNVDNVKLVDNGDYDIIDELIYKYTDMDDDGLTPRGPKH